MTKIREEPSTVAPPAVERTGGRLAWASALAVLALGVIAATTLLVDWPVSQWFVDDNCPGQIQRILGLFEPFGHGVGVLVFAIAIYRLDPGHRRALPRVLTAALGAGMATNVAKMLVARIRPKAFDFVGSIADTFPQLLPLGKGSSAWQSFPSGHTATAFGLAMALAWLYPRGRGLFFTLAVLVGVQRVTSGYHFPSDVLCGAVLGWLVGSACVKASPLARWFDRREHSGRQPAVEATGDEMIELCRAA